MSKVVKHSEVTVSSHTHIEQPEQVGAQEVRHSDAIIDKAPDRTDSVSQTCQKMLAEARFDARRIIKNANDFAANIVAKAEGKIKAEREKARADGYAQGLAQGKKEAQTECTKALGELSALVKSLETEKNAILAEQEHKLKELSFSIAEKIIASEMEVNNELFISLFKNAVKDVGGSQWIKVMVSEYEVDFATAYADLLLSMVKDAKEIKIIALDNAPRGTLLVETRHSIIDAGVDTQMRRLRRAFDSAEMTAGVHSN